MSNSSHLKELLAIATSAVQEAGAMINEYTQGHNELLVEEKKGGSSYASQVVTKVDLLAQEILLKHLLPTCQKYDLGLLTEESDDNKSRLDHWAFWSIDPLDGTLPFIEGSEGFAVSVALVQKEGTPLLGAIYHPPTERVYTSLYGQGAYINGKSFSIKPASHVSHVSHTPADTIFTFMHDRSFLLHPLYQQILVDIKAIALNEGYAHFAISSQGGAVVNALWTLEKSPACYLKLPKKEEGGGSLWDYSATASFALESGAHISDCFGEPLELNREESTFMNHKGVLFCSDHTIAQDILRAISRVIF